MKSPNSGWITSEELSQNKLQYKLLVCSMEYIYIGEMCTKDRSNRGVGEKNYEYNKRKKKPGKK